MTNQAQIEAVEHLLLAVLKRSKISLQSDLAFEDAYASLLGSDGPGGPEQKSEAVEYLTHLKSRL